MLSILLLQSILACKWRKEMAVSQVSSKVCSWMHSLRQQLWTADKHRMRNMRTYHMSSSMPR